MPTAFLRPIFAGLLILSGTYSASAQDSGKKPAAARTPNPAFATIQDNPALPRVLLIGDSISIGYTLAVREELKDAANVHRIPTNGGPTTNGLKNLDRWLGDSHWDVIHFNWGLHDLKFVGNDGTNLVAPTSEGAHPQVALADYERNLTQLVKRLKQTQAQLIWCTTTPVPEGSNGRRAGDERAYNEAAARVMQAEGVLISDLCVFEQSQLAEIQLPKNVHFTPEGSKVLARHVAAEIRKALPDRKSP